MDVLNTELQQRWNQQFADLVAGDDVPPTIRLRTEGMMEAVVLAGIATEDEVVLAMEQCYAEIFGASISDTYGGQWRTYFPFPQIPAMGARAPVYPSTKD